MLEHWKDIPGYEGRYQVSDLGRVKSLPFYQRYLLRNGKEAYRLTKEKIRKPKKNNRGYLMLTLSLDNVETTALVHRLVATAFVLGDGETVNHIDGKKTNNVASNLEWVSYRDNHLHAVALGLNKQALRVVDPSTGARYDSITQAEKATGVRHQRISQEWARA